MQVVDDLHGDADLSLGLEADDRVDIVIGQAGPLSNPVVRGSHKLRLPDGCY